MSFDVDSATFRRALGTFPTGVTIVTTVVDSDPYGLAVGSFFSVSLVPPLVGFCIDEDSSTWTMIERSGRFCVNVLAHDQLEVCARFADKEAERFRGTTWRAARNSTPVLEGCLAWISCHVDAVHEAGDHFVVIGAVEELAVERQAAPLVFLGGDYPRLLLP